MAERMHSEFDSNNKEFISWTEIADIARTMGAPNLTAFRDRLGKPWNKLQPHLTVRKDEGGRAHAIDIGSIDKFLRQLVLNNGPRAIRFGRVELNALVGARNKYVAGEDYPEFAERPRMTKELYEEMLEEEARDLLLEEVEIGNQTRRFVTGWSYRRSLKVFNVIPADLFASALVSYDNLQRIQRDGVTVPESLQPQILNERVAYLGSYVDTGVGRVTNNWGLEPHTFIEIAENTPPATLGKGAETLGKYARLVAERGEL